MNATDIWSGHLYAYVDNKPNNVDAPYGADKVKAIRIIKRVEPPNTRETTFVVAEIVERNGNNWVSYKVGERVELRARYFVDFWSDYAHRREEIDKEESEREERMKAERIERQRRIEAAEAEKQRILQEKIEERAKDKERVLTAFTEKTSIPRSWLVIENGIIGVKDSTTIRLWLSVPLKASDDV